VVVPAPAQERRWPLPARARKADAPQRLLRPAVAAALSAPQRVPDLRQPLTASESLPLHRDRLERTERLIAAAEENGNARLVESGRARQPQPHERQGSPIADVYTFARRWLA
jgi:hypothetical protein